jgi:hypothetical protein
MVQARNRLTAPAVLFLAVSILMGAPHAALSAEDAGHGSEAAPAAPGGDAAAKAAAPETPAAPGGQEAGAGAKASHEEPVKQIQLTEEQVKNFVAAQPDIATVSAKLQQAGNDPDAALRAELDGIAKKHGFASFSELDDVAANIAIVMAGLDQQTGEFTDPVDALKKELADVTANATLSENDKKQLIDELNDAIKTTPPLEHKENVDIVKAHRNEIEKALE